MSGLILVLKKTWKIWVPALVGLVVFGTIAYQYNRIKSLKTQRDVAIVEHDRAMEQQKQLLKDLEILDNVLQKQREFERQIESDLATAKEKIRQLSQSRPDVDAWRNTPIPVGVWQAVRSDSQNPDSDRPD